MASKNTKSKRTEVHDAHDRYANQEVHYLSLVQSGKPRNKAKARKVDAAQQLVENSR